MEDESWRTCGLVQQPSQLVAILIEGGIVAYQTCSEGSKILPI